ELGDLALGYFVLGGGDLGDVHSDRPGFPGGLTELADLTLLGDRALGTHRDAVHALRLAVDQGEGGGLTHVHLHAVDGAGQVGGELLRGVPGGGPGDFLDRFQRAGAQVHADLGGGELPVVAAALDLVLHSELVPGVVSLTGTSTGAPEASS